MEGLIRVGQVILAHSWVALDGVQVDPTLDLEFGQGPPHLGTGQRLADQYVALEALSVAELHARLGVAESLFTCGYNFTTPLLPYLWNVQDRRFPSLYTFGLETGQIVELIGEALEPVGSGLPAG